MTITTKHKHQIGDKIANWTLIKPLDQYKKYRTVWLCRCDCGREKEIICSHLKSAMPLKCDCQYYPEINTGFQSGKLTVISDERIHTGTSTHFLCKCECGNIKSIRGFGLSNQKVISCGCIEKKHRESFISKQFGKLLVLEEVSIRHRNKPSFQFKCKCDCGNEVVVSRHRLLSGQKSCGCAKLKGNRSETANSGKWARIILDKSNYKCKKCGCNDVFSLTSHHIKPVRDFMDQRFDENNGVCLCCNCHKFYHTLYQIKNINEVTLTEFLSTPNEELLITYKERYEKLIKTRIGAENISKIKK